LTELDSLTDVDHHVRITPPLGITPPATSTLSSFDDATVF
jgi:hypothetical protein